MIYYTGDLHGDIRRVCNWMRNFDKCEQGEYYLIQLGDAGLNYYLDERDIEKKSALQDEINRLKGNGVRVQILFVRGNHECRPDKVQGYVQKKIYGGKVYVQEEYPDLIFLKDGEIFQLDKKYFLVLGGGYSKDFFSRILRGEGYWFDEQLDEAEFMQILNTKIPPDVSIYIVSHMLPVSVAPGRKAVFSRENRTEYWLQTINEKFFSQIVKWLAGHYHFDREMKDCKYEIVYNSIKELA